MISSKFQELIVQEDKETVSWIRHAIQPNSISAYHLMDVHDLRNYSSETLIESNTFSSL